MLISIIIPALNEEGTIASCLASIAGQEPPYEVLVIDGGSTDRTREEGRCRGARVHRTPPGRARQMNAGAGLARGSALLFLHADSQLPPGGLAALRRAIASGVDAGAFNLRFDASDWSYGLASRISDLYCRWTGDLFGDRAIFVKRSAFDAVGGFHELEILEDLDLAVRLRRQGFRVRLLHRAVTTSARRFRGSGIWRGGYLAWRLCRAYHRGRDLEHAARRFYVARPTSSSY